jgi:hypothetical protein
VHVEIAFYLAAFLLKQHGEKESGTEKLSERGKKTCARTWTKRLWGVAVLRQQIAPDNYMPVFDSGKAGVNVFLARVRFSLGKYSIEECCVGFVLPMMLERVNIGLVTLATPGLCGGRHRSNMSEHLRLRHLRTRPGNHSPVKRCRMGTNQRESETTMRVMISILAGAATLGLAPMLGAQQKTAPKKEQAPMKMPAPDKDGCVTTDGRTECMFRRTNLDSAMMKRPALGIQLSPTGTMRDTLGVFVSRVTPKGPAENAGIVEGDRIVSINGVDLRVNASDAGDSYAAELPTRRLTREVAKLTPGSVANVRVYSGGRTRDVQVTVGRASDLRERGPFGLMLDGMPGEGGAMMRIMPDMEGMRMQLRDLPRMRPEDMEGMRMQLNGLRDRLRMENFGPLRDGQRFRLLGPSRVRVFRDGDGWITGDGGDVIIHRSQKAKTKADKEKAEKTSKEKKDN